MKDILIIEDEHDIAELITLHLKSLGHRVTHFDNGKIGYSYAISNPWDIMILDLNLPGLSGIEVCQKVRAKEVNKPILMLTANSEEDDKILGLNIGADDYMTKPFSVKELTARVSAMVRRADIQKSETEDHKELVFRDLLVDKKKRKVTIGENRVELTPKEFDLLHLLMSNPGVTYSRKDLLNQIWSYDFDGYDHTVNSHINRLRSKVEKDPNTPEYVLTTWGVGYRFNDFE
ncbi:MAG TPA: DNA-binding response regulator [Flavobacteriales bacterium]|nr:DNA-binding response regulator [Flavobacteriales bacterium]|tara:strand:- start:16706 stop:17401 length:696 start_codon:yes stop_codon:yes gene_type:complete